MGPRPGDYTDGQNSLPKSSIGGGEELASRRRGVSGQKGPFPRFSSVVDPDPRLRHALNLSLLTSRFRQILWATSIKRNCKAFRLIRSAESSEPPGGKPGLDIPGKNHSFHEKSGPASICGSGSDSLHPPHAS